MTVAEKESSGAIQAVRESLERGVVAPWVWLRAVAQYSRKSRAWRYRAGNSLSARRASKSPHPHAYDIAT